MPSLTNLPIPGFTADPAWGNQWSVGTNQKVLTYFDEAGRLRFEKDAKFTLHTVLRGDTRDLDKLQPGNGVSLAIAPAYTVALSVRSDKGVRAQLIIHEFDNSRERVSRLSLGSGERARFVPATQDGRLVLSLRLQGQGGTSVEAIEFNPARKAPGDAPGLHGRMKLDKAPSTKRKTLVDTGTLMSLRNALYAGTPLSALLKIAEAKALIPRLMSDGYLLETKEIVRQFDLHQDLSTSFLRKLFWHGSRTGYLKHALACIDEVAFRSGNEGDEEAAARLRSEYEFHRDPWALMPVLPKTPSYDSRGAVLHMVGKALPEKQTGYTVRTKYTVEALQESGVECLVAVQAGGNYEEGLEERLEHRVNGVRTVLLAGPAKKDVPRDKWMAANAESLLELVREVRPSVIHAHSDFTNGALATHVGEATDVPVVYESRGFWEETWISRISKAQAWEDVDQVIRMYGAPELYELRRESERKVRERADGVVTLAQTMKNFILAESAPGAIEEKNIYLARNAVEPGDFPGGGDKSSLRKYLGIGPHEVVVGYISSIVEYEGIETLIEAYRLLKDGSPEAKLLIVGDGPYLNRLRQQAERAGLDDVIFPGRVPHEEVLSYYHTIDIFVVPRRRSRVTELVTPLKPFEAFSTGRAVVLSDVEALAEIAADSEGAARTFPAENATKLAEILHELVKTPTERRAMGSSGAQWVREKRSWKANVPVYHEVYSGLGAIFSTK